MKIIELLINRSQPVKVTTLLAACCFQSLLLSAQQPDNSATVYISRLSIQSGFSVLPVSLYSFKGDVDNKAVLLNWQTASESNNSHFEVLRFSPDEQTPVKIGKVIGKGNSNSISNYFFTDNDPLTGTNYYQLRQVDFDGKYSLSEIITVKAGLTTAKFHVYQNAGKICIANIHSDQHTLAVLTLVDVYGRILHQINTPLNKGDNIINFYNKPLNPGVYIASLVLQGNVISKKFSIN